MAKITPVVQGNALNLSARQLKQMTREAGAEWSDDLVNDYLSILQNILVVSGGNDDLDGRVETNEQNIAINAQNISNNADNIDINAQNISTNASNIQNNADAIAQTAQDLDDHVNSNAQHGVTGNNVGTEDFCTTTIGGVVQLMELVANAVQSTQQITSPGIVAPPATYDQAYTQTMVDLANETKTRHNQLVNDLNLVVAQFNDLMDKSKAAKQMSTT